MSSIMRWRSALPGRCEGSEVIGGSSLELKVAGPSMLGIGCPDRHALLLMPFPSAAAERTHPEAAPSRESGFVPCPKAAIASVPGSRHVLVLDDLQQDDATGLFWTNYQVDLHQGERPESL